MKYRELDVWVNSRELVKQDYESTKSFPKEELYELETQIYLSNDLESILDAMLKDILLMVETCMKLLNGFTNDYKKK